MALKLISKMLDQNYESRGSIEEANAFLSDHFPRGNISVFFFNLSVALLKHSIFKTFALVFPEKGKII